MNDKKIGFARRYETALRKHLKLGAGADLKPALGLGRRAVILGMETLGLAQVHELAAASLGLPGGSPERLRWAESFFSEAMLPIADTHRAARESRLELKQVKISLGRRTAELMTSNRLLKKGVARRKSMEAELAESGRNNKQYLQESLKLQDRLRQLTRRVLEVQESERSKISRELQHEIAQTLLGINVRLLSLKQEARHKGVGLESEIASTQRLVADSVRSVRRSARRIGGV